MMRKKEGEEKVEEEEERGRGGGLARNEEGGVWEYLESALRVRVMSTRVFATPASPLGYINKLDKIKVDEGKAVGINQANYCKTTLTRQKKTTKFSPRLTTRHVN